MIKENQQLLNRLNVLSDAIIIYLMIPLAFWIRFYVMKDGHISMTLQEYLWIGLFFTAGQVFLLVLAGMYRPFRHVRISRSRKPAHPPSFPSRERGSVLSVRENCIRRWRDWGRAAPGRTAAPRPFLRGSAG